MLVEHGPLLPAPHALGSHGRSTLAPQDDRRSGLDGDELNRGDQHPEPHRHHQVPDDRDAEHRDGDARVQPGPPPADPHPDVALDQSQRDQDDYPGQGADRQMHSGLVGPQQTDENEQGQERSWVMTAAVADRHHRGGGGPGPGHATAQSDHDMPEALRDHLPANIVPPAGTGIGHDGREQRVEGCEGGEGDGGDHDDRPWHVAVNGRTRRQLRPRQPRQLTDQPCSRGSDVEPPAKRVERTDAGEQAGNDGRHRRKAPAALPHGEDGSKRRGGRYP